MTRSRPRRPLVLLLVLSGLAAFGGTASAAATADDRADRTGRAGVAPILTGAAAIAGAPGTIAVTGEGFTPGGAVVVVVYDRWGATPVEIRSATASRNSYGPNGSQDPAIGFKRGGILHEALRHPCGAAASVRAYDRESAAWSNWLDVDATAVRPARYGPNGSADPALGFRPGCEPIG